MSRGGTSLFGGGTLDEVAVYNRALSAATVAEHYASSGTNRRPIAALTLSQTSVKVNKTVTFRATGSIGSGRFDRQVPVGHSTGTARSRPTRARPTRRHALVRDDR